MSICSKCKDTKQVSDSGLLIVEMLSGGLIKANHPPRIYPCPKCLSELHNAICKEYTKLCDKIKELESKK